LCDFDDALASSVIESENYGDVQEGDIYRALKKITRDPEVKEMDLIDSHQASFQH
jgi:hypothetical protein